MLYSMTIRWVDMSIVKLVGQDPIVKNSFKSTPTIMSRDLRIEGEVSSFGILEIEGSVKGTINGNTVILRENGFVEGTITAESLSIRGTFEGTIKAKNLNISSKAKLLGNVEYDNISVEDGACIDGQFKKISKDKPAS